MNYSKDYYIIIFFLYGLSFFSLGVFVLLQKNLKESDLNLIKPLKNLGFFGIVHGSSEWVIMLIIWDAYPELKYFFSGLVLLLNVVSYLFLWFFGVSLFEKNQHKKIGFILFFLTGLWLMGSFLIVQTMNATLNHQMVNLLIMSRNIFGFPSAFLASIGLYKKHQKMQKIHFLKISKKLLRLSGLFFFYGILTGVISEKSNILLSEHINSELFLEIFKVPIQVPRALIALVIAFNALKLVNVFMLEAELKIEKLKNHELICQERRAFSNQLHDEFIQNLFAIGLMLDSLMVEKKDSDKKAQMQSIIDESIKKTRGFIHASLTEAYTQYNLVDDTEDLIQKLSFIGQIKIEFNNDLPALNMGSLSSKSLLNVYYIVKESINNAIKHSKGTLLTVEFSSDLEYLKILIDDNGEGLSFEKIKNSSNHGLTFMRKRAEDVGADFKIENKKNESGVKIEMRVPWEG